MNNWACTSTEHQHQCTNANINDNGNLRNLKVEVLAGANIRWIDRVSQEVKLAELLFKLVPSG
eukprot:4164413-Amphidinium_carterae.1